MPKDTTPKEALAAIQDRIQRERKQRAGKQSSTPPRQSARLGSASNSSSPAQKDSSPPAKNKPRATNKKSRKLLDDSDSDGEGKEGATNNDAPSEADAEKPPDYKDRVVSTTTSDNRPSIGKVGEYSRKKGL